MLLKRIDAAEIEKYDIGIQHEYLVAVSLKHERPPLSRLKIQAGPEPVEAENPSRERRRRHDASQRVFRSTIFIVTHNNDDYQKKSTYSCGKQRDQE